MPSFDITVFLLGCLGGTLPDILKVIKNRYNKKIGSYYKRTNFWLGLILLIGIGGLAAWILDAQSAKDALIYGFAAPEIFSKILSEPLVDSNITKRGTGELRLRQWWST